MHGMNGTQIIDMAGAMFGTYVYKGKSHCSPAVVCLFPRILEQKCLPLVLGCAVLISYNADRDLPVGVREEDAMRGSDPKRIMARTIQGMAVGDAGYAPPTALVLPAAHTYVLQADAAVQAERDANFCLHVVREATGFVVDVSFCAYPWRINHDEDIGTCLPVARIVFGDGILS